MCEKHVLRSLGTFAGALVIVAAVVVALTRLHTADAATELSLGARQNFTLGFQWDFESDTTVDFQNFSTMFKDGVILLDGFVLPESVSGEPNSVEVGPGHGKWKYNATNNRLVIDSIHGDPSGGSRCYRMKCVLTPSSNSSPVDAKVTIKVFDALGDLNPVDSIEGITTSVEVVDYL